MHLVPPVRLRLKETLPLLSLHSVDRTSFSTTIFDGVVQLNEVVYLGEKFWVARGTYEGMSIIGKVSNKGYNLAGEYRTYQQLRVLQGICIPICLGLFRAKGIGSILILEDCGEQVAEEFEGLTDDQK